VKKPIALLLGIAACGLASGGTAVAQVYYYGPGFYGQRYYAPGLAPWRVARIVRAAGLTPLSAPARRGPTYEVMALDPDGRHVRVMVDAYQGAITSVRPVAVLRQNEPYAPPPRVATAPSLDEAEAAVGPRAMPGGPAPYGTGAARAPQVLPPQALPPQALPPQALPPQANLPPSSPPPYHSRLANAPAVTGATPPAEIERTPIPRPRPSGAATAAVTPSQPTTATPPAAATTAPADVPEAPPAPTRARPSTPAAPPAASAAASAKTTTGQSPATTAAASRAPTTLVPVAPLE
jgi:hypothetical protein